MGWDLVPSNLDTILFPRSLPRPRDPSLSLLHTISRSSDRREIRLNEDTSGLLRLVLMQEFFLEIWSLIHPSLCLAAKRERVEWREYRGWGYWQRLWSAERYLGPRTEEGSWLACIVIYGHGVCGLLIGMSFFFLISSMKHDIIFYLTNSRRRSIGHSK